MRKSPPDMNLVAKIERNLVGGFAAALAALWVLGEQNGGMGRYADEALKGPIVGGTPIILLIIFVIFLNAWFVAAETSLNQLKNMHVKLFKDDDSINSLRLQNLMESKQK